MNKYTKKNLSNAVKEFNLDKINHMDTVAGCGHKLTLSQKRRIGQQTKDLLIFSEKEEESRYYREDTSFFSIIHRQDSVEIDKNSVRERVNIFLDIWSNPARSYDLGIAYTKDNLRNHASYMSKISVDDILLEPRYSNWTEYTASDMGFGAEHKYTHFLPVEHPYKWRRYRGIESEIVDIEEFDRAMDEINSVFLNDKQFFYCGANEQYNYSYSIDYVLYKAGMRVIKQSNELTKIFLFELFSQLSRCHAILHPESALHSDYVYVYTAFGLTSLRACYRNAIQYTLVLARVTQHEYHYVQDVATTLYNYIIMLADKELND
jgi:hypothetical protein